MKTSHACEKYEAQPFPLANNVLGKKSIDTLILGFLAVFQRRN
jgi:hypothetical protein